MLPSHHSCPRRPFRRVISSGVVVLIATGGLISISQAARASSGTTITVDASSAVGVDKTNLSTQLVYHGVVEGLPNGQAQLNALHMPMIRIHTGSDATYAGYGPELPEGLTKGAWSFAELDQLVSDARTAGALPILNVRYAPNWMWTCTKNFAGDSSGVGGLADPTYNTFADYMARLVSYYNKGSMLTENGTTIVNPAGTSHRIDNWELWNEPDLSNEDPCHPASWGPALSAQEYTKMWNVVAPKMRAVDPTVQLIGPTTANPNEPTTAPADDYFATLMANANPKPNALSFHVYGWFDNAVTDQIMFDGDGTSSNCCGGIPNLTYGLQDLSSRFPGVPVYVSEMNVNAAYGNDPSGRPWGALGAAWGGSAFRSLVLNGASLAHQYEFASGPQFGYVDESTGQTYLPYWRDMVLAQAFPAGSTIVSATSTTPQVETLAVKRPDGSVAVLVVNRQVNSATTTGGPGLPATVTVNLSGLVPASVKVRQIDANTSAATGPTTQQLGATATVALTFPGYGMAVVEASGTASTTTTTQPATTTTTTKPTTTTTQPPATTTTTQPTTTTTSPATTTTTSPATTTTTKPPVTTTTTTQPPQSSGGPPPMALISKGAPAYSNDDCSGAYPAGNANDSSYMTYWLACGTPSASSPKWLAYDLSGVATAKRGRVLVSWYNDPITSEFDHSVDQGVGYNNVGAYTIQANAAGGGTAPTANWVTLATVTANTFSSRQHLVDMTGYNWLRMAVTASDGSAGNSGVALNLDVQDASAGAQDSWIFYGDSITQDGMPHDTRTSSAGATVGTFAQLVNGQKPLSFPAFQDGGIGGLLSADGAAHISTWLSQFAGKYVSLAYGTNDALASANDPAIVQPYHDNMVAMVNAVLAAGKVPVLPTIPWGRDPGLQANVPVLNNQIALIEAAYPQVLHGPDLYTYFKNNQSLISADGIHPIYDTGYAAYRQQWANWAITSVYGAAATAAPAVSLSPSNLSFPSQAVAATSPAQTVTVKNTGTAALAISGISVTGVNAGDFAQSNACPVSPSTLAVGATCAVSVTFKPAASGARSASISVADNATGSPHLVALTGTGATPGPLAVLSPLSLAFAGQLVGSLASSSQTVTVQNLGTTAMTISSITIGGTNPGDFTQTNTCPLSPATLPALGQCVVSVKFAPAATGTRTASISVADNSAGGVQTVPVSGTGTSPAPTGLFSDGFESGAIPGAWSSTSVSSTNTLSLDAALKHSGNASLKAVQTKGSAGNASITRSVAGQTILDVRGYYYLSNPVNWGAVQLISLYAQGQFIGWATYNVDPSSPALTVYNGANNALYSCSQVPSLNAWHSLELQYKLSTTATGSFTLWIDGVKACGTTAIKTAPAAGLTVDTVVTGIDNADNSAGLTVHVDDVVVGTSYVGP